MSDDRIVHERQPHGMRKAILGGAWYFVSSLVPAFGAFIIFSLASRQILPHDLGMVTLSLTIAITLTGLCAIGYGDALIQYQNIEKKHIDSVFIIISVIALILYSVSNFFVYYSDFKIFEPFFKNIYPLISLKIIFDAFAIIPLSILTRDMNFRAIGKRTIYCAIASLFISLPILYFGGGAWAMVISQLLASIVSFFILWFSSPIRPGFRFDRKALSELNRFGITTTFSRLITSVSIDNIIIGFIGNVTTLGIYSFSRRIFSVVSDVLNGALSNVSYPLYSSMQHQIERLKGVYLQTTFLSASLGIPCFLGLLLLAPKLIPFVFGEHWSVAITTVQFCCSIGFISCIGSLQLSLMKGLGKTSWILKYQLFQQITTACVASFFSSYGALYVTAAIAIKTYLIWPYAVYSTSKILDIKIGVYLSNFIKPIVSSIIMFVAYQAIREVLTETNTLIYILVQIFICFIVYSCALAFLARKEIREILSLLRKNR